MDLTVCEKSNKTETGVRQTTSFDGASGKSVSLLMMGGQMDLAKKYGDLVYDVGMHQGEDTDYYLKKGFRVVGFEANPKLVAKSRSRFADAIREQRLIIVEGAITDKPAGTNESTVSFYENAK